MHYLDNVKAVAVDYGLIGQVIRAARGDRSQKDVAGASGIGADSLSDIELGKAEPKLSTLERIADALGMSLGVLLLRAGALDLDLPLEELLGADPDLSADSRDLMRRFYRRLTEIDREGGATGEAPLGPLGGAAP